MKLFRRDSKNCDSNNAVSPEVEPSVEEKTEPVAPPKKNSAYTPKKGYATPRRRDVERARGIQRRLAGGRERQDRRQQDLHQQVRRSGQEDHGHDRQIADAKAW